MRVNSRTSRRTKDRSGNIGNKVELTVSQIRREIYLADPHRGAGHASHTELGTVFHRLIAQLLQSRDEGRWAIYGGASIDDWANEMMDWGYRRVLGPYLHANSAALHGRGSAVLSLWEGAGEATRWLAELFWDHRQRQIRDGKHFRPQELANWFQCEVPLRVELTDEHWSCPVILTGVADSLLSLPNGRRCVLEYKIGKTLPDTDLCQAALYHLMLGAADDDSLALVSFLPQKQERLIEGAKLGPVHLRLKALIGRIAGVDRQELKPDVVTSSPNLDEVDDLGKRLRIALREAGCEAKLARDPIVGPTFVRFVLSPAHGVSPRKFLKSGDLLQVRLQLERPPVIQIGSAITVDLQRPDRQIVHWQESALPKSDPLHGSASVLIGVGLDGQLRTTDLADTASYHILVAGTSGSGKSEWLRTAIAGLIATNTTEQLRIVAIDPKRVAFHDLQDSPYLHRPVVFPGDSATDVVDVLDDLIEEMERRYRMLDGCASISQWIDRHQTPISRIVCVCDEYADLMLGSTSQRSAIESRITRLGAKARASGIHLILATQQPSRKTITGAIQANLPGRVGLTMTSATESRMMFGESGAENLLMKGDLLYKDIGSPQRYQAIYLPKTVSGIFSGVQAPLR